MIEVDKAPSPEGGAREFSPAHIQVIVAEAMLDAWNTICSDTDCHPMDIEQLGRRRLGFHISHWARQTGAGVAAALRSSPAGREEIATGAKFNDPNCCMGTKDENACPCMSISPSAPMVIIAGIRQFGLAPDGSDLRDLESAILALTPTPSAEPVAWIDCDRLKQFQSRVGRPANAAGVVEYLYYKQEALTYVPLYASTTTVSDASREALERALREARRFVDPDGDPTALNARVLISQIDAALSPSSDTTSAAGKSGGWSVRK